MQIRYLSKKYTTVFLADGILFYIVSTLLHLWYGGLDGKT